MHGITLRLSVGSRVFVFIYRRIYVLEISRCCQTHLDDGGTILTALLPGLSSIHRPDIFNGAVLQKFLQQLRIEVVAGNTRTDEVMTVNLTIDD